MPKGKNRPQRLGRDKVVPLENAIPDKKVIIGGNLSKQE
jgi:hypothetical protein